MKNIRTLERKSTVYDLIYKRKSGPDAVMKEARNQWSESLEGMNLKLIFRWIHLPANNVSNFPWSPFSLLILFSG